MTQTFKNSKRGLLSLDDYDDAQDIQILDPNPPQTETPRVSRSNLDYRNNCTPIRNQGNCGSCYAFSTIAAVEGNYALKYNKKIELAPQQLVDCDYNPNGGGNWGCSGGWMKHANDYLKSKGTYLESQYSYNAMQNTCKNIAVSPVKVTGYEVPLNSVDGIYNLLAKGPISQCVNVQNDFYYLKDGLYAPVCSTVCHHAIVIVGWAEDACKGEKYFIVRNSWGSSWGVIGYFKVKDTGDTNGYSCMLNHRSYSMRPIVV